MELGLGFQLGLVVQLVEWFGLEYWLASDLG